MTLITQHTHQPTNDQRRMTWRLREWHLGGTNAPDLFRFNMAQRVNRWKLGRKLRSSGQGSGSSRSLVGRAFYHAAQAIGLIVLATLAYLTIAVAAALLDPIEAPDTDCRMQFTNDVRYVKHCDFHDGRGYVEVGDE